MTWYDEYAPTCSGCLEMYDKRIPKEVAPCSTCRVYLLEENTDIAEVYLMTRGQVITAGPDNMPIDLSISAIDTVMDLIGVEDRLDCLRKVRWLWQEVRRNASQ